MSPNNTPDSPPNNLNDLLKRRRMVRNYQERTVDPEMIKSILEQSRRSPSAGHSQGVSYVVLTQAERRRDVAALAGEPAYAERGFPPWLSRAPVHIVLCVDPEAYHARYADSDKSAARSSREWPVPYWHVDAGASLMLLLLTAVERGLAAGFLGIHNLPGLQSLLGLPASVEVIGLVTLGYAAPDRRSASLDRGWKALDQVVHWEGW